jgi:predicted N-acetyltransferase YhbS
VPEIGLAVSDEIPALQEIERRAASLFRTHPQIASLDLEDTPAELFARSQAAGMLWVARVGGRPVGFALVEDFGTSHHLQELDVAPEYGRQGIGSSLVRKVVEAAAAKGVPVTLCTFSEVPWNAPFYERLGFVRLSPIDLEPALRDRVREETERGVPAEIRVAMRFDVGSRRTSPGN